MKVFLLGAGASKSYCSSPTNVKMPLANDFFRTFSMLQISENPWVRIGDIVNYIRDNYGIAPDRFMSFNGDIEAIHSEIEGKLKSAMEKNDRYNTIMLHRPYMQLIFLFTSVINEIQNGPVSKAHLNIASKLNSEDYVITFNWDTLMDRALYTCTKWKSDFGYIVKPFKIYRNKWDEPKEKEEAPKLIKLHGSTNWLSSYMIVEEGKFVLTQEANPDTFYVYEYTTDPYNTYDGRYMNGYEPFSYGYYPVNLSDQGKPAKDGKVLIRMLQRNPYTPKGDANDSGLVSMPLIIPPVKYKSYNMFGVLFSELWKAAEEAIRMADEIIIIGYSFPVTDTQSTLLFKNAFVKRNTIPLIKIIDPNPERLIDKFTYEFGIPNSHLKVYKDYFTEDYPIDSLV